MKRQPSPSEQEAQDKFLGARARYHAAKKDFIHGQVSAWQLHMIRDEYINAIELFAVAVGVLTERDLVLR